MGEARNDVHGPSWKNLLGLLPAGQTFDDPREPGAIEYYRNVRRSFGREPAAAAREYLNDYFAF